MAFDGSHPPVTLNCAMANVSETSDAAVTNAVVSLPVPSALATPGCGSSSLLRDPYIPEVTKLCKDAFGNNATVELMFDPEDPSETWLCFTVTANGGHADILEREFVWHENVERLTGDRTGRYRLSVYPVD